MKKRKPPIILATILIVCVGAGVAYNSRNLSAPKDPQAEAQQQQQQAQPDAAKPENSIKPRAIEDPKKIMARMNATRSGAPGGAPQAPGQDISIKAQKALPQPPDPNRTSQQWYSKEDALAGH